MKASFLAQHAASQPLPPDGLNPAQRALWLVKAGHWEQAHSLSQDIPEPVGAWIHAYLHRQEGDLANASYWYRRANQPMPASSLSLEDEWLMLADALSE